jgi:hypothetical protein
MAGLLNLVPRYLPRYGMAPQWTRAVRPLVLLFTAIALLVTVRFRADVDAQAGAYATGVLVHITSAAVAVALSSHRAGRRRATFGFGVVSVVFAYTTVANVIERPEGIQIASFFIGGILLVSFVFRMVRAFELRVTSVSVDAGAEEFLHRTGHGPIRLLAHEPRAGDEADYRQKYARARSVHNIPSRAPISFVEVTISDPSEFEAVLEVTGYRMHGYRVLRLVGPSAPNAIAALLLYIRARTGSVPHVYFEWSEGNPVLNVLRYLVSGLREVAPITREILRQVEHDPDRRPIVHVA